MRSGGGHRRIFGRLIPTVKVRGTGLTGNGVAEMTAVVSRERARATCLTGAAGALLLAVALVMMVMAAPGHAHGLAKPSVAQLTTAVGHQLAPSGSAMVPADRAAP